MHKTYEQLVLEQERLYQDLQLDVMTAAKAWDLAKFTENNRIRDLFIDIGDAVAEMIWERSYGIYEFRCNRD